MAHAEPFSMILLSCLLFLLPSLLCGPSYKGGNLDVNIDQGMIDDIFGSNLDSARYGNTDEEWVDVPITLLPEEGDDCGPMQQPRQEPQMMEMAEELQQIAVIKADPAEGKKCDFYTKTEGFECVPYYQCDEGTIITDGFGLIDIRFGGSDSGQPELAVLDSTDLMCPGSLDVCCKDPDFIKVKEELNNPYGGGENYDEEEYVDEGPRSTGYGEEQDSSEEDNNPYTEEVVVEAESSEECVSEECEKEDLVDPYSNSELEELEATTPEPEPDTYNVVPEKLVFQPQCGRRNQLGLGVRIQNYKDGEAQFGEWPHMCAVLRREITTVEVEVEGGYGGTELKEEEILVFVAGASLIAPGVVMTGAHKVNDYKDSFEQLVVRCGEWDTQTESEPLKHQDRNVSSGAIHQEFNPRNLYNTIALLFLETDFTLSSHVDTICLPTYKENFDDRTECYVKGWGKEHFGPDASYQVVMKEVQVPMVGHATCQDQLRATPRLPRQFRLHDSFTCAGGEAGKDACRGDGGGPLVCLDEGTERYTQVGIVAWGIGCGEENVPGVYTDVAAQVCWIDWTMACRNFNHVLFNGPECNAWYEEKKNHKVRPLRNLYDRCGITWGDGRNAEIVEAGEGGYGK